MLSSRAKRPAALASAGMLAPFSERLEGQMLALCNASRNMYPDFVRRLQTVVPDADVRYVSRDDFLVPDLEGVLEGNDVLRGAALQMIEPALGPRVLAAQRVRGDASVDSRLLMAALRAACEKLGVRIEDDAEVAKIVTTPAGIADSIQTCKGDVITAGHYVIASGAWTKRLLPHLPVRPVKGQMISVAPVASDPIANRLNHVLYGEGVYIVPKTDGDEFYVGATVEEGDTSTHNTPAGVMQLLSAATALVPAFADYEIREMWSGLRPATPDLMPILGETELANVSVASGHYRNGILLAPATAKIAAAVALGEQNDLPRELRELLPQFSVGRFFGTVERESLSTSSSIAKHAPTPSIPRGTRRASSPATPGIQEEEDIVLLWKILPDGSQEPVYPHDYTGPRSLKHRPPPARPQNEKQQQSDIKVWKVQPDGTNEPVYPSDYTGERTVPNRVSLSNNISQTSQASAAEPKDSTHASEALPEGYQLYVHDPANVSADNDAYEDIMKNRGENEEEAGRKARAANRAFGRTKSSLEKGDSPVLSLSEEEVIAFDRAAEQGLKDMEQFSKCFDSNHPSVLATEAERRGDSQGAALESAQLNGVSVPLSPSISDPTATDKSDGYF